MSTQLSWPKLAGGFSFEHEFLCVPFYKILICELPNEMQCSGGWFWLWLEEVHYYYCYYYYCYYWISVQSAASKLAVPHIASFHYSTEDRNIINIPT